MQKTLTTFFKGMTILNLMLKGYKKIQQKCEEKIQKIIVESLDKPRISLTMYVNKCLIVYSQDRDLLTMILSMSTNNLRRFLWLSKDIVNYTLLDTLRLVFIPYAGGKLKHEKPQKDILNGLDLKKFNKYYEPFLGGFSSVFNSIPLLLENGIIDIFLSDINPSLINLYRQVQKNFLLVQKHLASLDLEYYRTYGKLHPETKKECKEWFNKVHTEFTQLEKNKRMSPRRAALFFYLMHLTQGGMLNFNMNTKLNKFTFSYDPNKFKKIPLLINKVSIFNRVFNLGNIKFSIRKVETVHKLIKNDTTSLILFDPPYIKYEEITTSKKVKSCSYNYGVNDFPHERLLKLINNGKYTFIYYNNHNPLIEEFSEDGNFNYNKMNVIYKNGKQNTKSIEILMFKDRTRLSVNSVNSCNFNPVEIKKVS